MPSAARLGDLIGHAPPIPPVTAVARIGAALVAGGTAVLNHTELASVAVIGALATTAVNVGKSLAASVGGGGGGVGGVVTGEIIGPCSGNVFTNAIPAARAMIDLTMCSLHPPVPLPIVSGSSNVFINGLPAARLGDPILCGAIILSGSGNVFIGGSAGGGTGSAPAPSLVDEMLEVAENGATLALGVGEIVIGGLYNSVVRIGAGLASIPYMLDSVDAAVGVQKGIAESLNYELKSGGAKQIGTALQPVGAAVQGGIAKARNYSEEKIGLGATAVVFGTAEAGVEIVGTVAGGRALKSFIDLPLPGATTPIGFTGAGTTKLDAAAEAAYSRIRAQNMTDVEAVASSIGMSTAEAITLKKQLFYGRHEYPIDGATVVRQRFAADHEIAFAWNSAAKGQLSVSQQSWLQQLAAHELAERSFMAKGIPYLQQEAWNGTRFTGFPKGAHDMAPAPPKVNFPGYETPWHLLD